MSLGLVGLARIELATYGLGNRRSVQLSYNPLRKSCILYHITSNCVKMARAICRAAAFTFDWTDFNAKFAQRLHNIRSEIRLAIVPQRQPPLVGGTRANPKRKRGRAQRASQTHRETQRKRTQAFQKSKCCRPDKSTHRRPKRYGCACPRPKTGRLERQGIPLPVNVSKSAWLLLTASSRGGSGRVRGRMGRQAVP